MSRAVDQPPILARRPAIITAASAAIVFVALAVYLVPWDWIPGGDLHAVSPRQIFTPNEIERAEAFSSSRRLLGWSSYFLSLAIALVLGLSAWGSRLVGRATRGARWWVAVLVGVTLLLCIGRLLTLPFAISLHDLNMDYGLSNQPWDEWAVDYLKSLLVAAVMSSLLVILLVGAARRWPRTWFAWAGGFAVIVTFAASFLYPVVVEPLFNTFTPMKAGPFKSSVFALADAEGVHIDDVLVSDASRRTTTLNAYVSGLGGTRRVVVYDNLLNDLSPDEARVVIAHELAHAKHNDVLVGTTLGAAGGVFGVSLLALALDSNALRTRSRFSTPGDARVVAAVLALVALGGFLASPIQNTISRAIEARADRDSILVTGEGRTFIDMQHELAIHSLSDPTPWDVTQFWFGSHPTVLQRAGMPASLAEAAQ